MNSKRKSRLGRNIRNFFTRLKNKNLFRSDFNRFHLMAEKAGHRFPIKWKDRYPCLKDDTGSTRFNGHYLLHTAWAARKLKDIQPVQHTDISSSLYFNALVSAFVPINFYDYRPAKSPLSDLTSDFSDLMKLPFEDNSLASISCMHVIEHIGLGRYGDKMDPDGDITAISELKRVTASGGSLLFVVPVGKPRIQFNAHRIYSYDQIIKYFDGFTLKEFALIPDEPNDDNLIINATEEQSDEQNYGCGCFWFVKN
jgi:SAM-dependent methyltransferase